MEEKVQRDHVPGPLFSRGCCLKSQPQTGNSVPSYGCAKLDVNNWLQDIHPPDPRDRFDLVEVRFKNNRKEFFRVPFEQEFNPGDIVAVEGSPGHDIGIVSASGETARLLARRKKVDPRQEDMKKIYRKARVSDIEKWIHAIKQEDDAVLRTRKIAGRLNLNMKVNDVEYQGDNTKAIFYYTADERVDFRELIKVLAEEFRVRIEMKQIGVRQEAGRLGGIGTCGRELCCSTWLDEFHTVSTQAARIQQLSLNPQKLAGQCGKLKCCLNYEYATYIDATRDFPNPDIVLRTRKGDASHQKTDVFGRIMWYTYNNDPSDFMAITVESVKEIIEKNKKNVLPEKLEDFAITKESKPSFEQTQGLDDINRFDE